MQPSVAGGRHRKNPLSCRSPSKAERRQPCSRVRLTQPRRSPAPQTGGSAGPPESLASGVSSSEQPRPLPPGHTLPFRGRRCPFSSRASSGRTASGRRLWGAAAGGAPGPRGSRSPSGAGAGGAGSPSCVPAAQGGPCGDRVPSPSWALPWRASGRCFAEGAAAPALRGPWTRDRSRGRPRQTLFLRRRYSVATASTRRCI